MTAHPRTDAVRVTPEQVAAIAKRWPSTVVVVGQVDNPRYVPVGSVWVGVDGEPAGIVLLPDGSEETA